jgi:phosphoglycolate phosphatase
MRYSVLSFDLDGTLVDTAAEIAEAVNRTLAEFGVPRQDEERITRHIGHGARHTLLRVLADLLLAEPDRAERLRPDAVLPRWEAHYGTLAGRQAKPYPGCAQMLRALRLGGVRLACLTNKEHRHAQQVLQRCGLAAPSTSCWAATACPSASRTPPRCAMCWRPWAASPSARPMWATRASTSRPPRRRRPGWAVPWGYDGGPAAGGPARPGLRQPARHRRTRAGRQPGLDRRGGHGLSRFASSSFTLHFQGCS